MVIQNSKICPLTLLIFGKRETNDKNPHIILILYIFDAIFILANALSRFPNVNIRSPAEGEEMRSAIKYLQDLDDFYSQIARPR